MASNNLSNRMALASALFGRDATNDQSATTVTGTVQSDSSNGTVSVLIGDPSEVVDPSELVASVPIIGAAKTGDEVQIIVQDGVPTAIGAPGWGDYIEANMGGSQYVTHEETGPRAGLHVHDDPEDVDAGGDLWMTSAKLMLRRLGVTLATFADNLIELGINSVNAVISLCGGKGTIDYSSTLHRLKISAGSNAAPEAVALAFPPIDNGGGSYSERDAFAGIRWQQPTGAPNPGGIFEAKGLATLLNGAVNMAYDPFTFDYFPMVTPVYKARHDIEKAGDSSGVNITSGQDVISMIAGKAGEVVNNPPYFDGSNYIANAWLDIASNGIRCKRKGIVFVFASMYAVASNSINMGVYVRQNGIERVTSGYYANGGNAVRQCTTVLSVSAGDIITMYGRSASTAIAYTRNSATFLMVMYLA